MGLRLRKAFLLTRKELKESLKSKEVILIITLMPLMFAVIMPLCIPLVNLTIPTEVFTEDDFESFPALVPYWDELDSKGRFLIFFTMIFFESFLLLPMILPMAIAGDSIAGERERKTIESLIASPLTTEEIVLGKLMTTMIPSVLITWFSGIIFMLIADLSLYGVIGRLVFPNMMSAVLLLCTILLLLINLKIFDREYMIASVRG